MKRAYRCRLGGSAGNAAAIGKPTVDVAKRLNRPLDGFAPAAGEIDPR